MPLLGMRRDKDRSPLVAEIIGNIEQGSHGVQEGEDHDASMHNQEDFQPLMVKGEFTQAEATLDRAPDIIEADPGDQSSPQQFDRFRRNTAETQHPGKETIRARVFAFDDPGAELAEIDENLERSSLMALETAQHLKRREALYQEKYPETKPGGDRKGCDFKTTKCRFDSFSEGAGECNGPRFADY